MKKIVFLMLFTASAYAQVDIPGLPEMKQVPVSKMDYACSSKGALFYLSAKSKQMFVSDPGNANEGFELSNVDVKSARCLHTHTFSGTADLGGETVTYRISTHGCGDPKAQKVKGQAATLDKNGKQIGEEISLVCKVAKK